MVTMKEKNEKELAQHNAEMKELVRIIDHEHKLREFMNRKVLYCSSRVQYCTSSGEHKAWCQY